jgi:3-hydroxyacyl-CoA dehydrogenase
MPVGPLEVIDQTSLSLSVNVMEQDIADLKAEGKPLPPEHPGQQVIVKMVKEFKRPGRAAGGGFYEYPKDGRKFLWPELGRIFGKPGVQCSARACSEREDRRVARASSVLGRGEHNRRRRHTNGRGNPGCGAAALPTRGRRVDRGAAPTLRRPCRH